MARKKLTKAMKAGRPEILKEKFQLPSEIRIIKKVEVDEIE